VDFSDTLKKKIAPNSKPTKTTKCGTFLMFILSTNNVQLCYLISLAHVDDK